MHQALIVVFTFKSFEGFFLVLFLSSVRCLGLITAVCVFCHLVQF